MKWFPHGRCVDNPNLFLPDFCQFRVLLSGLVLSQLLAFALFLSPLGKANYPWSGLLLFSISIHLVTLTSLVALCWLRTWFCQLNNKIAGLGAFFIILLVTAVWSEIFWVLSPNVITSPFAAFSGYDTTVYIKAMSLRIRTDGDVQVYVSHQHLFILLRNLGLSAIVGGVALRYFYVMHQWKLKTTAEAEARMQALQSRMRPHFLFNTMNTIASLIRIDPDQAEQAVEDFSDLMRAALGDARQMVPLRDELHLCRQYLRIEGLRMGERLQVEWRLDMLPEDALMPSLSLQPLLENAVSYGVHPIPEGGVIRVSGLSDGKFLKIDVENPIPVNPPQRKGNKIAQENLRQRLAIYFGRRGRLDTQAADGYYTASLRFPYQKGVIHESAYRG